MEGLRKMNTEIEGAGKSVGTSVGIQVQEGVIRKDRVLMQWEQVVELEGRVAAGGAGHCR